MSSTDDLPERWPPDTGLGEVSFDMLLTEVLVRVSSARDEQERWRLLLDAVVSLGTGVSLDDLLGRIVEVARDLVGAQYAALGVLGRGGRLRMLVTRGLDDVQISSIGDLPEGHGVLGVLIDRPEPVRLHDIAQHPQSFGFPDNHPPMRSFLGVPVRTGEKVFGNLYLTEKANGGDFTDQDEAIAIALASAAGVAIENAQLHEEATRRERWLDARGEIARALLGELDGIAALQLVADKAREVGEADVAWIVTGPEPELLRVEVVSGIEVDRTVLESSPLRTSVASPALQSGRPLRIEDLSQVGQGGSAAAVFDISDIGPAVMVPLSGLQPDYPVGLLALGWWHGNEDAYARFDLAVATAFAEQSALALRLSEARENRERVAVYDERERIGRDLHDVVIQRLFAIGLRIQGGLKWAAEQPELTERLDEVVDEIDETIREIRRTIFELGSGDQGEDVQSQVTAVVDRAASSLKFRPSLVFEGPVRLRVSQQLAKDVVAVLGEALSNISRHARATQVAVELAAAADELVLRVSDNGVGVSGNGAESGLANMRARAAARHGRCTLSPREEGGTVLEWSVPLT